MNREKKIFLYGTDSRVCTLINRLDLGSVVDYAIDDQKEKRGHYMPGCFLPIISLDDANEITGWRDDGIVLLAVNHENEAIVSEKILSSQNGKKVKLFFFLHQIISLWK